MPKLVYRTKKIKFWTNSHISYTAWSVLFLTFRQCQWYVDMGNKDGTYQKGSGLVNNKSHWNKIDGGHALSMPKLVYRTKKKMSMVWRLGN